MFLPSIQVPLNVHTIGPLKLKSDYELWMSSLPLKGSTNLGVAHPLHNAFHILHLPST